MTNTTNIVPRKKTWVYIDGFNLYYGSLNKGRHRRGFKWLNLEELSTRMFPKNNIVKVKYFSARISGKYDANKPVRQSTYWRALETITNLEIIEGRFLILPRTIYITKETKLVGKAPQEKGTDVNIATHLVNDAHNGHFEAAIVISNDSDLAEAIKIVTGELKLPIGIANPSKRFNKEVVEYASFKKLISERIVKQSQFPNTLTDTHGSFNVPASW